MFKKIFIILILLCLCIGVVSANPNEVNDLGLKLPQGFSKTDDAGWVVNNEGFSLCVRSYSKPDESEFTSSDDGAYSVTDFGNNTFASKNSDITSCEAFELVRINDKIYFVLVIEARSASDSYMEEAYRILMEFNELNNLEPIPVSEGNLKFST